MADSDRIRLMRVVGLEKLVVGGREVKVTLKNKSGSRKITLRVTHEGIVVSKPRWVAKKEALGFVFEKREWIAKQIDKQEHTHRAVLQDHVYYLGEIRTINHAVVPPVCFVDGEFWAPGTTIESRLQEVTKWMRRRAGRVLKSSVLEWSERMSVNPTKVGVRDQTSRWGSCSSSGSISLNWRLVMTPPTVLNYIVIHELAHLVEHNHSKRFWIIVERYCPEYRACEKWLDANGEMILLAGRELANLSLAQPLLFNSTD